MYRILVLHSAFLQLPFFFFFFFSFLLIVFLLYLSLFLPSLDLSVRQTSLA